MTLDDTTKELNKLLTIAADYRASMTKAAEEFIGHAVLVGRDEGALLLRFGHRALTEAFTEFFSTLVLFPFLNTAFREEDGSSPIHDAEHFLKHTINNTLKALDINLNNAFPHLLEIIGKSEKERMPVPKRTEISPETAEQPKTADNKGTLH